MVSDYLKRPVRDQMGYLRELALTGVYSDWETLSQYAGLLRVVAAETDLNGTGQPVFTRIAGDLWDLAGYESDELIGRNPTVLQCDATNLDEARRLMPQVRESGAGEVRIINQRKTGELYGCRIVAVRVPRHRDRPERLIAFLRECPMDECP